MASWKVLLSNIGYARGISGQLNEHILRAHRHIYCSLETQRQSLKQLSALIEREDPDVCCFVEIDEGSFTSSGCNQLRELATEKLQWGDIASKYGPTSLWRSFFLSKGNGNAIIAKHRLHFDKLYFSCGVKKLVYKVHLEKDLTLFFSHFSLSRRVRRRQIAEARKLMDGVHGKAIFMGDFNILEGLDELEPILRDDCYTLLNRPEHPTFRFHRKKLMLDLCLCSKNLAARAKLKVVPQPFSDHAALVLELHSGGEPQAK